MFFKKVFDDKYKDCFLIVGLGNPGAQYAKTRHNFGFMVLEQLASKWNIKLSNKSRYSGFLGQGKICDKPVNLLLPMTYMNLSGRSVKATMSYNNIPLEKLIVAYDDIDLNFGQIRLRSNGGTGGHKGMESIASSLMSKEFNRVRLGIGPKMFPELSDYVLAEFTKDERESLPNIIDNAVLAIESLMSYNIDKAMQDFNKSFI